MTQKKLEIIGPYTPEHEGPFSFSGEECLVHATLGTQAFISRPESDKGFIANTFDIMNAREVPVAREFWVNEYKTERGNNAHLAHETPDDAMGYSIGRGDFIRIIHVREVMPGDGE